MVFSQKNPTRSYPQANIPKASLLTAAFFVGSSIHIPLPPTSIHLILNGLMGTLLGYYAFLAIPIGLFFQAVIFNHGGMSTLGVNTIIMGVPAIAAYHLFRYSIVLRDESPDHRFCRKRLMKELTNSTALFQLKNVAISITDLCFKYSQERSFLTDINLQILAGEKIGLIGANGAGKTTLFLAICGLLKSSYGSVKLFNRLVNSGEFYPEIGLVFQNPDDQLFCPTVKDDIAFGPENMGLSPEEIAERVDTALSLTGVSHLKDRVPHHLSGGEKCMVAIASVLAMQPQIILYDEPSANLDLKARRRLIRFLKASPETIILSSHDLELVLEVCDRVILLNQGRVMADGIPQEIMSDRILMESNNLEVPHSLTHHH